ncbi:type II toxin-antitoxin system HicA family toxin (plasmid) [Saccharobesus litoralis]|uniref:Type II toxin-antitoxin system HicA family toxin n=1 Tax=Saccharobesus litoralis TaxID=2172099 RepID=A0A2S0VY83_9ALTE|nr:type II toxin-antitoxin system HicA family toxin [Saccharobesus litoralis]AWB69135.1 type II toxin-antitoxin system HicA family toxin [Saccharobesus litoralis]
MGKQEKLLIKLSDARKVFPWNELVTLLSQLGYEKKEMAGSRVRFYHYGNDALLLLHKPHPENELKGGALKSVKSHLKQEGWL